MENEKHISSEEFVQGFHGFASWLSVGWIFEMVRLAKPSIRLLFLSKVKSPRQDTRARVNIDNANEWSAKG